MSLGESIAPDEHIFYTDACEHLGSMLACPSVNGFLFRLLNGSLLVPPERLAKGAAPDVVALREEWDEKGAAGWVTRDDGKTLRYELLEDVPTVSFEQALDLVTGGHASAVRDERWRWREYPAPDSWEGPIADGRVTRIVRIDSDMTLPSLERLLAQTFNRAGRAARLTCCRNRDPSRRGKQSERQDDRKQNDQKRDRRPTIVEPLCPHCLIPALHYLDDTRRHGDPPYGVVFEEPKTVCRRAIKTTRRLASCALCRCCC